MNHLRSHLRTSFGCRFRDRKRPWQLLVCLLLLALIVAPVSAAPPAQEPQPQGDIETGELEEAFIEYGPPDGGDFSFDPGPPPAIISQYQLVSPSISSFSPSTLRAFTLTSIGDLPSYDEEALARFDVQKALESVWHLAVEIGPRVTGTPQEQEAAEYFGAKLASYGYEVTYQHWAAGTTKYVAWVTSPNVDLLGGPGQTLGGPKWQMSASTSAKFTGDAEAVEGEVIYAGSGQSDSDFPPDTAGKIVMMNYSGTASIRNTAVVNAVNRGAIGVILVQTGANSAPPSAFSLTTPQPNVPVVGGGSAHRIWINNLLAQGPLRLRIATYRYLNPQGTNVVGVRRAVNDPSGTSAPIIMVGGHIDSVLGAPGAHDNATGPSSAVEIGRVLSQYALDKEVRIVGYGGEEIGMYGSRAYVAGLSPAERARFVGAWDMDMEGTPYEPARFWALTPDGQSNFVVQSAYDAAARLGFADMRNCRLGQSDHQSFYDAGIPASLFIWLDYRPNVNGCNYSGSYVTEPQYHRPTDTMSNVSPERLEISIKIVGGAAFHSALNAVTLSASNYLGAPIAGATVRADCGEGWRKLGLTDSNGRLQTVIPHATCDFTATTPDNLAVSRLEDVEVFGDRTLAFPPPPVLSPSVSPNPVLLRGSATAAPNVIYTAFDLASAECEPVDTSSVGAKSVACTATDIAGNMATASANYNVIYNFAGFFDPVANPPTLNIANSGQAIPLKWRITDANGNAVTDLANVGVTTVNLACSVGTSSEPVEEYAKGASGLQYLGDGYYQFNWATPKSYAKSCKALKLDLGEGAGMERIAQFQFVK